MVKLLNPEEQSCHFYPDRVVYRSATLLDLHTASADQELKLSHEL